MQETKTTHPSNNTKKLLREVLGNWARKPALYLTKRIKRIIEVRERKLRRKEYGGSGNNHHHDKNTSNILLAIKQYRQQKQKAKNRAARKVTQSTQRAQARG